MLHRALRKFGLEIRPILADDDLPKLTIVSAVIEGIPITFAVSFKDDHIQRHHYKGEFYEQPELDKIAQYFRGGTFVDIGANVGNHVLFASKFLQADRVIAFEPGPLASTVLRCNVGLNDIGPIVEVRQVALSDTTGTATFEDLMPYNLGGARVRIGAGGETVMLRGDEALSGEKVDFIKIDTEGLEVEVLRGLMNTLKIQRPTVFVEVDDRNANEAETILSAAGYSVLEKLPSYDGMSNWIAV